MINRLNHLNLSSEAQEKLMRYVEMLQKWNKTFNLIGKCSLEELYTKHILDSLSVISDVSGEKILDVGTGAGLPGVPLAIALPEKSFTLIDSNSKKTRFLTQVCLELDIQNIHIVNERVEQYHPALCFDSIISRAFSSVQNMVELTQHLLCQFGYILCMKGKIPEVEFAGLEEAFTISVQRLAVEGLMADRHLIMLQRKS
ncbi:MAG: 16S rRNA (guanine(527)-N(7))-methyltransferase RsmG [Gammaproteobacteria bacterium]